MCDIEDVIFPAVIVFFVMLAFTFLVWSEHKEDSVTAGYGREFICEDKQVVKSSNNGYIIAQPCKAVEKND